jgi:shikimate kinase
MRIYLIGFKCCGKTTTGKALAPLLGFDFLDLDEQIEQKYGDTIPALYSKLGEAKFRTIERKVFNGIPQNNNIVLATGGGFPRWQDNMETLVKTGITIFIYIKPQILFERMNRVSFQRPVLNGMKNETLMDYIISLTANYEQLYRKAAITYNVEEMSLELLTMQLNKIVLSNKEK